MLFLNDTELACFKRHLKALSTKTGKPFRIILKERPYQVKLLKMAKSRKAAAPVIEIRSAHLAHLAHLAADLSTNEKKSSDIVAFCNRLLF